MKIQVIYHKSDYDGIFCREIAHKFLGDAITYTGWDFGDRPVLIPPKGTIYILDLPVDRVFGLQYLDGGLCSPANEAMQFRDKVAPRIIWIDHHKSSIETHPTDIPGYRIDGVAACRLAWQWFTLKPCGPRDAIALCDKDNFVSRNVIEPLAVRLAGEYDIWDHRGDGDVEFQFGLDAEKAIKWEILLRDTNPEYENPRTPYISGILDRGGAAMRCYAKRDAAGRQDAGRSLRRGGAKNKMTREEVIQKINAGYEKAVSEASSAEPASSAKWCQHIERDYGLQGQSWRMAGGDWHAIPRSHQFCPFCGKRKPKLPRGRPIQHP